MAQAFPFLEPRAPLGEVSRTPLLAERHEAELRFASSSSEAAKQVIAAEGHLNRLQAEAAVSAGEAALKAFRSAGDAVGCAESLRIVAKAQQIQAYLEDEDARSLNPMQMLSEELAKAKSSNDRTAQAILQLGILDILSFGTAATSWMPSRTTRDKALEAGQEAAELFESLGDRRLRAITKLEISMLLSKGASPKSAFQAARDALDMLEPLGEKTGMGRALYAIATSHVMAKDYESAMKKGLEALDLIRSAGDKRAEAVILETLVSWSLSQEKPHKALVMAKEALALRLELEAPPLEEARACLLLVEALAGVKKVRRGLKAAEDCLDRLKKVSDRANVYGLVVMAMAQLKRDHPELALTATDEAIDIAREMGDKRLEMSLQYTHAEVNVQLQSRVDALEAVEDACTLAEELQDKKEEGDAECLMFSLLARGTLDRASLLKALKSANKARELYQKAQYRIGEAKALIHKASVLGVDSASSSAEEMLAVAAEAHDIYEEEEWIPGQSAALQLVAEAQLAKENFDEAASAAKDRRAIWKGLGCRKEEGDAVLQLARIHLSSSDYDAAEKHGLEAQKIFQEVGDKAAESVACVHLAQACLKKMSSEAEGETKEALASSTYRTSAERAMRAVNDAITACRHLGSKQLRAGALFWRAQVLGFRGRLEEALRVVMDAEKCFESIASGSAMVQCKVLAADCLAGLKHFDEAKEVADQAIKQASGLHDRQAESQAKSCLERIEKAEKKSKEVVAPPVQAAIATEVAPGDAPAAGAPAAPSAVVVEKKGLDPAAATKRLMAIVKDVIAADDEISADSPLMEAGMDSLSSVQLVTEVSKEFSMSLSPSLVFDFPNVSSIVNHLVEETSGG